MYASPDEEAEGVLGRLRGLISRVRWAAPAAGTSLAPALRGAPYAQHAYQAADVQIVLDIQPATSGYRRQRLLGQVKPAGMVTEAELWHEGKVLESGALDEATRQLMVHFYCRRWWGVALAWR
jgi:hypothetical protein